MNTSSGSLVIRGAPDNPFAPPRSAVAVDEQPLDLETRVLSVGETSRAALRVMVAARKGVLALLAIQVAVACVSSLDPAAVYGSMWTTLLVQLTTCVLARQVLEGSAVDTGVATARAMRVGVASIGFSLRNLRLLLKLRVIRWVAYNGLGLAALAAGIDRARDVRPLLDSITEGRRVPLAGSVGVTSLLAVLAFATALAFTVAASMLEASALELALVGSLAGSAAPIYASVFWTVLFTNLEKSCGR